MDDINQMAQQLFIARTRDLLFGINDTQEEHLRQLARNCQKTAELFFDEIGNGSKE